MKGIVAPELGPKSFGTFEKQAPEEKRILNFNKVQILELYYLITYCNNNNYYFSYFLTSGNTLLWAHFILQRYYLFIISRLNYLGLESVLFAFFLLKKLN